MLARGEPGGLGPSQRAPPYCRWLRLLRAPLGCAKKRNHLVAELDIIAACGLDESAPQLLGLRQGAFEEELNSFPALGVHAPRSSSRWSQARRTVQSRLAVAIEIPSTAAVSSIVMPPKNRYSTMRACRGFS